MQGSQLSCHDLSLHIQGSVPSFHPQFHQVLWSRQVGCNEPVYKSVDEYVDLNSDKNFEMSRIGGDDGGVVLRTEEIGLVFCEMVVGCGG